MNEQPTEKSAENPSLASLEARLDALKKTRGEESSATPKGDAARGAIDFASASAVGILLGFGADYVWHSSPWGLIVGLFVGVAAGFRLLMRAANESKKE